MKTALEFFNSYSLDIVGYTLLHSLWQGLLISIIVAALLRVIPSKLSNIRYTVATVGLLSMVVASLFTFTYLSAIPSGHISFALSNEIQTDVAVPLSGSPAVVTTYLSAAQTFIEFCMPFFLIIWVAGALIFSLRIFMGLAYVERLREGSVPLGEDLNRCIQEISAKLKIEKLITIAESSTIEAPVVIGYLKPFILIPMGMCANLSTAQLETIFIHELMHIRRKDYLVNLVQSFVEAIYFFNPFIWVISDMVRSEREHCCDDAVVHLQGNATVYASALATLEEVRLSKSTLSLSLAGNKNELLKRIKRLMEKSVKNHYSGGKFIPALLLVIGLVCASWISTTIGPGESDAAYMHSATIVQDTTKKGKKDKAKKKAQRNRAAMPSNDIKEDVEIEEQVEVDNDVNVEEQVETDDHADFSYGPPPVPDFHIPPMPEIAGMMPPLAELNLLMEDFVPPHPDWNDKDWEKFSKEFEEKFKSNFGEFYEKNEEGIQKMMQEIQQNLNDNFGEDFEAKMQDFAKRQEQWAKANAERLEQQAEKMALHGQRLEGLSEEMHQRSENIAEEFEKKHKDFEKSREEFEKRHKAFEERSRNFNKIMKEELIKDGYLDRNEKLENIHYHNGVLKINGKAIKAEDQEKYNGIREKYFETPNESGKDE